jgi:hypothetical protein
MDRVTVVSEIPATHPGKRVIENASREALRGLIGSWTLAIRVARGGSWWLLRLEGPGFDRTLIVDPPEQKPAIVQARLREILRDAGVTAIAKPIAPPYEDRSLADLLDCWLRDPVPQTRNAS